MTKKKRLGWLLLLVFLVLIPLATGIRAARSPLPVGLSFQGPVRPGQVSFLYDLTYQDSQSGEKMIDQEILPEAKAMIAEAQDFILLDVFLFNDTYNHQGGTSYPAIAQEMVDALIQRKEEVPHLEVLVLTDPLNSFYQSYQPRIFAQLEAAGIHLIQTDLKQVKDSNPLYSSFYRAYISWLPRPKKGHLPNIFDPDESKASLRSYLDLLNFKANHRKVLLTEKAGLISSANIHDASGYHSNIAFKVQGPILEDLVQAENAVLALSGYSWPRAQTYRYEDEGLEVDNSLQLQVLTEGKIKETLLKQILNCQPGDQIKLGLFYLADRDILRELESAARKGVQISVILDQNKEAFGQKKLGIPNKPVALRLRQRDTAQVRWYHSQGEQFHAKFAIFQRADQVTVIGGSANFSRRNLDNLNLELDLALTGPKNQPSIQKILSYYDRLWENQEGLYTVDYEDYAENKLWKTLLYLFQEASGLSTF